MSKHNGRCDVSVTFETYVPCGEVAVHHGPQHSECVVHHAEAITRQAVRS
jgi:hypothetical protein